MTWKQRWIGDQGEGFLWPIYLFVVFYFGAERWLHTDSAYTLFRILNHQSLFYDRFACELLVWPGQLLSHLGAPIRWVMQSINLILPLMAWLGWIFPAHATLYRVYTHIACLVPHFPTRLFPQNAQGVLDEVQMIKWPTIQSALLNTVLVVAIVAGTSVVLFAVNTALAELSREVYARL